jgi:opacity protein-like surface antigen
LLRGTERLIWEIKMRKTVLTVLGSALIAASAAQMAAAAQPHRSHKADRAAVMTHEQFRDSNAYAPLAAQPDWSRYNGGMSAPAGR